jgi:hypothetical protein
MLVHIVKVITSKLSSVSNYSSDGVTAAVTVRITDCFSVIYDVLQRLMVSWKNVVEKVNMTMPPDKPRCGYRGASCFGRSGEDKILLLH